MPRFIAGLTFIFAVWFASTGADPASTGVLLLLALLALYVAK